MNGDLLKRLPKPEGMDKSEILELLLSEEYGFLPDPPAGVSVEAEAVEELLML